MFSISNKAKYALAAMFTLAMSAQNESVQAKQLAAQCQIPIKFLEHILSDLRQTGLVRSQRGSKGGYFLAKSSEKIMVSDIIVVIDGPIKLSSGYCGGATLIEFWQSVEVQLKMFLSLPLSELVLNKQKKEQVINYAI